jgi:hypothetical protein
MWCSKLTRITRHHGPNISNLEAEWQTNNLVGRSQNGESACFSNFSHTYWREVMKFESDSCQESDRSIVIDSQMM